MSKLFVLLLSILSLILEAFAATELQFVSHKYYNSSELTRLSEYFTGQEYDGRKIFLRSQKSRDGFYFSFPIPELIVSSSYNYQIMLSIIKRGDSTEEKFSFELPQNIDNKNEIFVGLTGNDWSPSDELIAWKLVINKMPGQTLFLKKSFLWDHD